MLPASFYKRKQGSIYFSHYFCVRLQIHTQCSKLHGIISIQSLCRLRQDLYAGCGIHQAFDNQSTCLPADTCRNLHQQGYGRDEGAHTDTALRYLEGSTFFRSIYWRELKINKLKIKGEGGGGIDGSKRFVNRAGIAQQYMLHDYSRFRVETL